MSWLSGGLSQFSSLTDQISTFTKDVLSETTEEIEDPTAELQVARKKIEELEDANTRSKTDWVKLKEHCEEVEERADTAECQIAAISQEYRKLLLERDSELRRLKSEVTSFRDQNRKLVGGGGGGAAETDNLSPLRNLASETLFSEAQGTIEGGRGGEEEGVWEYAELKPAVENETNSWETGRGWGGEGERGGSGRGRGRGRGGGEMEEVKLGEWAEFHDFGDVISSQGEINRLQTELARSQLDCQHWRKEAREKGHSGQGGPIEVELASLRNQVEELQLCLQSERGQHQQQMAVLQGRLEHVYQDKNINHEVAGQSFSGQTTSGESSSEQSMLGQVLAGQRIAELEEVNLGNGEGGGGERGGGGSEELSSLMLQLSKSREKCENLDKELKSLLQERERKDMAEEEKEEGEGKDALANRLQAELKALRTESSQRELSFSHLQQTLKRELEDARKELGRVKERNVALEEEAGRVREKMEEESVVVEEEERKRGRELEAQVCELRRECEEERGRLEEKEQMVRQLQVEVLEIGTTREELRDELQKLKAENSDLQDKSGQLAKTADEEKTKCTHFSRELDHLRKQFSEERQNYLQQAALERENLSATIAELQTSVSQHEESIMRLQSQCTQSEKDADSMSIQVGELAKQIEVKDSQLREMKSKEKDEEEKEEEECVEEEGRRIDEEWEWEERRKEEEGECGEGRRRMGRATKAKKEGEENEEETKTSVRSQLIETRDQLKLEEKKCERLQAHLARLSEEHNTELGQLLAGKKRLENELVNLRRTAETSVGEVTERSDSIGFPPLEEWDGVGWKEEDEREEEEGEQKKREEEEEEKRRREEEEIGVTRERFTQPAVESDHLRSKVDELKAKLVALENEKEVKDFELLQVKETSQELQAGLRRREEEVEMLRKEGKEQRREEEEVAEERRRLDEEVKLLRENLKLRAREIVVEKEEGVKEEVEGLREMVKTLEQQMEADKVTLQDRTSQLQKLTAVKEKEESEKENISASLAEARQNLNSLTRDNDTILARNSKLTRELEALRSAVKNTEEERGRVEEREGVLTREMHSLEERLRWKEGECGKLSKQLEQLKIHLVQVEERFTEDCLRAEHFEKESRKKIEELQAFINHTSATGQQESFQTQQQVSALKEQLHALARQRDAAVLQLSRAQDEAENNAAAVKNLQTVLEQFQRDQSSELTLALKRSQTELADSIAQCEQLRTKQRATKEEISSLAAEVSSLRRRLREEEERREVLQLETSRLQSSLQSTEQSLEKLLREEGGQVDRNLVKNLVIKYVQAPDRKKGEVLQLIGKILNFSQSEMEEAQGRKSGWLGSMWGRSAPPTPPPSASLEGSSLSQLFVSFLESESTPSSSSSRPPSSSIPPLAPPPSSSSSSSLQTTTSSSTGSGMDPDRPSRATAAALAPPPPSFRTSLSPSPSPTPPLHPSLSPSPPPPSAVPLAMQTRPGTKNGSCAPSAMNIINNIPSQQKPQLKVTPKSSDITSERGSGHLNVSSLSPSLPFTSPGSMSHCPDSKPPNSETTISLSLAPPALTTKTKQDTSFLRPSTSPHPLTLHTSLLPASPSHTHRLSGQQSSHTASQSSILKNLLSTS